MKVIALCVFLVVVVKTHVSGNLVEEFVRGDKIIEKKFDFIKNDKTSEKIEKFEEEIIIKDLEAKFTVMNTGMKLILNYKNEYDNIVFKIPEKKDICFISKFDETLKKKIPFMKLKKIWTENKDGTLPFPKEIYKIKTYKKMNKKKEFNHYGTMAKEMCRGLTHVLVTFEEQTTAVATHDHIREKRDVGVGEVILIIIIIIILF